MKYINADKLKDKIDVSFLGNNSKDYVLHLIDELSEEREEDERFCLEDIKKEFLAGNKRGCSGYPDTDNHTQPDLERYIKSLHQPNPLKVAIKADGTEEYGKKIIEYFKKLGYATYFFDCCTQEYYFININGCFMSDDNLPKGYTEISLKEEEFDFRVLKEQPSDLELRVEAIEQKLKKLSE